MICIVVRQPKNSVSTWPFSSKIIHFAFVVVNPRDGEMNSLMFPEI